MESCDTQIGFEQLPKKVSICGSETSQIYGVRNVILLHKVILKAYFPAATPRGMHV